MKKFLVLYTCAENSENHQAWKKLNTKEQKERAEKGIKAKLEWTKKYKHQIVFEGTSLGNTKNVNNEGIQDIPSLMGEFLIIQANSHDEAAQIFLKHPHFAIFPGDGVQIIEYVNTSSGE